MIPLKSVRAVVSTSEHAKLVHNLGGKVHITSGKDTTHFIIENNRNENKTHINKDILVVKPEWLKACMAQKRHVDETKYLWTANSIAPTVKGPRRHVLRRPAMLEAEENSQELILEEQMINDDNIGNEVDTQKEGTSFDDDGAFNKTSQHTSFIATIATSIDTKKQMRRKNEVMVLEKEVPVPGWSVSLDDIYALQLQNQKERSKGGASDDFISRGRSERISDQVPLSQDPNWGDDVLVSPSKAPSRVYVTSDSLDGTRELYVCPDLAPINTTAEGGGAELSNSPVGPNIIEKISLKEDRTHEGATMQSVGNSQVSMTNSIQIGDGFVDPNTLLLVVAPAQLAEAARARDLTTSVLKKRHLVHQSRLRLAAQQHLQQNNSQSQSESPVESPVSVSSSTRKSSIESPASFSPSQRRKSTARIAMGLVLDSDVVSPKCRSDSLLRKSPTSSRKGLAVQSEKSSPSLKSSRNVMDLSQRIVICVTGFKSNAHVDSCISDSLENVVDFVTHLCAYANATLSINKTSSSSSSSNSTKRDGIDSERALSDALHVDGDRKPGMYFHNSSLGREETAMRSPATVLVVPYDTPGTTAPRSLSVLHAIARGVPVVTQEWVDANIAAEVHDTSHSLITCENFRAQRYAHLPLRSPDDKARTGPLANMLFAKKNVFVGTASNPSSAYIKSLVQWMGGINVGDMRRADITIFGEQTDFDEFCLGSGKNKTKFNQIQALCGAHKVMTFRFLADSLEAGHLISAKDKIYHELSHEIQCNVVPPSSDSSGDSNSWNRSTVLRDAKKEKLTKSDKRSINLLHRNLSLDGRNAQKRHIEEIAKEDMRSSSRLASLSLPSDDFQSSFEPVKRRKKMSCPSGKCRPDRTCPQCRVQKVIVYVDGAAPMKNPPPEILRAERAAGITVERQKQLDEEQQKQKNVKKRSWRKIDVPDESSCRRTPRLAVRDENKSEIEVENLSFSEGKQQYLIPSRERRQVRAELASKPIQSMTPKNRTNNTSKLHQKETELKKTKPNLTVTREQEEYSEHTEPIVIKPSRDVHIAPANIDAVKAHPKQVPTQPTTSVYRASYTGAHVPGVEGSSQRHSQSQYLSASQTQGESDVNVLTIGYVEYFHVNAPPTKPAMSVRKSPKKPQKPQTELVYITSIKCDSCAVDCTADSRHLLAEEADYCPACYDRLDRQDGIIQHHGVDCINRDDLCPVMHKEQVLSQGLASASPYW
jgi:hypothetical protein